MTPNPVVSLPTQFRQRPRWLAPNDRVSNDWRYVGGSRYWAELPNTG